MLFSKWTANKVLRTEVRVVNNGQSGRKFGPSLLPGTSILINNVALLHCLVGSEPQTKSKQANRALTSAKPVSCSRSSTVEAFCALAYAVHFLVFLFQPEPEASHIHPRCNTATQAGLCAERMVPLSSPHFYSCHGEQGLCLGCSFREEINSALIGSGHPVRLICLPYAAVTHMHRRITGKNLRVL